MGLLVWNLFAIRSSFVVDLNKKEYVILSENHIKEISGNASKRTM